MSSRLRMTRAEKDALAEAIRGTLCYRESEEPEKPTVDVVPVVRCKDCKYYQTEDVKCPCNIGLANGRPDVEYTWIPEPDWFCADGERQESE